MATQRGGPYLTLLFADTNGCVHSHRQGSTHSNPIRLLTGAAVSVTRHNKQKNSPIVQEEGFAFSSETGQHSEVPLQIFCNRECPDHRSIIPREHRLVKRSARPPPSWSAIAHIVPTALWNPQS